MTLSQPIQAAVLGRVGIDLYPTELGVPLRAQRRLARFVGGFAGNVATGLARLGVRPAIVSRVGAEGNGDFVREFLDGEGVDTRFLAVDRYWLTPPTFVEIRPPDDFPLTFYRRPTCPDWQLAPGDFDADEVAETPLLYATATALAQSPSRETTLAAMRAHRGCTIFDLDWRPGLWDDPGAFPRLADEAIEVADLVIGGVEEIAAARTSTDRLAAKGKRAIVKRGPRGASVLEGGEVVDIPPRPVRVVNGLGAGDALAAAVGQALLAGLPLVEAARRGTVAGAIVAARLSCSEAMPRLEELEAALA